MTKTRGPNIIEEIDHRPATEVVREWCPMSDEFIADHEKIGTVWLGWEGVFLMTTRRSTWRTATKMAFHSCRSAP